jgi:hypothetical protein
VRNRAENSLFISRNRLVIQVGLGQSRCPDRTPDRRDVGSDQAGARVISEVGPEPFERYDHSIAHPGQEQDVDHAPDPAGDSAGKAQPTEIGDCRLPADRCETACVASRVAKPRIISTEHESSKIALIAAAIPGGSTDTVYSSWNSTTVVFQLAISVSRELQKTAARQFRTSAAEPKTRRGSITRRAGETSSR